MASSPLKQKAEPWYRDGLRFECTQCGDCCTGAPGYVYVSEGEIEKIASFLGRVGEGLSEKHLRRAGPRFSLTEDGKSGDCCFLKTEGGRRVCGIYPVRPMQCRTWPFWDDLLESAEDWEEAAGECPGMNKGRKYEFVQIEVRRTAERWEELGG